MIMAMDEESEAIDQEESVIMPATSTQDPRTYDPTQGQGTPAWQAAVKAQMELNAKLRRN